MVHEKNILKVEVNKEIGSDIQIHRYEDVVDDDHYYSPSRRPAGVVRINVDSNNNTAVIPERKTFDADHMQHRVQTLVIDDANNDKFSRRALNIEGQNYVQKNEVINTRYSILAEIWLMKRLRCKLTSSRETSSFTSEQMWTNSIERLRFWSVSVAAK